MILEKLFFFCVCCLLNVNAQTEQHKCYMRQMEDEELHIAQSPQGYAVLCTWTGMMVTVYC